jgi:hypothetical protein
MLLGITILTLLTIETTVGLLGFLRSLGLYDCLQVLCVAGMGH